MGEELSIARFISVIAIMTAAALLTSCAARQQGPPGSTFLAKAQQAYENNDWTSAQAYFVLAQTLDPNNPKALNGACLSQYQIARMSTADNLDAWISARDSCSTSPDEQTLLPTINEHVLNGTATEIETLIQRHLLDRAEGNVEAYSHLPGADSNRVVQWRKEIANLRFQLKTREAQLRKQEEDSQNEQAKEEAERFAEKAAHDPNSAETAKLLVGSWKWFSHESPSGQAIQHGMFIIFSPRAILIVYSDDPYMGDCKLNELVVYHDLTHFWATDGTKPIGIDYYRQSGEQGQDLYYVNRDSSYLKEASQVGLDTAYDYFIRVSASEVPQPKKGCTANDIGGGWFFRQLQKH